MKLINYITNFYFYHCGTSGADWTSLLPGKIAFAHLPHPSLSATVYATISYTHMSIIIYY